MTLYRMIAAAAALLLTGVAVVVAAMLLAAVPAHAKVSIIKSSSPALASGSTFAWAPVPASGYGVADPEVANQITAERLRMLTESTLTSKGFRQVADPSKADLVIAYTIILLPEQDAKLTADGIGCRPPFCGGTNYSLDTTIHTQGMLVLDMYERETGRLVWRATSKKRITYKDASEKKLTALLKAMTKSLPQQ